MKLAEIAHGPWWRSIAEMAVLFGILVGLLLLFAEHFDSTEIKVIIGMFLAKIGIVGSRIAWKEKTGGR